jgi:hypothetical protein
LPQGQFGPARLRKINFRPSNFKTTSSGINTRNGWSAHADASAQLRHQMRDKINNGLVGIVSEGTDETVDMALALTGQAEHDRLVKTPRM